MFRAGELETDINSKIILTIGIVNSCIESIGSEDLKSEVEPEPVLVLAVKTAVVA